MSESGFWGPETSTVGWLPFSLSGLDLTGRQANPSRAQASRGCCRELQQIHVVAWLVHSARRLCPLPSATPIFPRAGVSGAPHAGFGKARAPQSTTQDNANAPHPVLRQPSSILDNKKCAYERRLAVSLLQRPFLERLYRLRSTPPSYRRNTKRRPPGERNCPRSPIWRGVK